MNLLCLIKHRWSDYWWSDPIHRTGGTIRRGRRFCQRCGKKEFSISIPEDEE